jgi:hypothetical protein
MTYSKPLLHETILAHFGPYQVDTVFGTNQMFLRFGYWRRVDAKLLQEVVGENIQVIEDSLDDDDCGTLWSYKLK